MAGHFSELPATFNGLVRLFPLPNLVMFPHVVQPLHIFEPRYCDMLEEALASDKLITMALLQPGHDDDYEGRPPIEEITCVARVVSHTRLPDNRHNLLIYGLQRAKLVYELPPSAAFRRARVHTLDDAFDEKLAYQRDALRENLISLFQEAMPKSNELQEKLHELVSQDLGLGVLTDIVAFTLALDTRIKQSLLAEPNVDRRVSMLIMALQAALKRPESILPGGSRDWPPPFSVN
jgi:ATP-dependent Lon protease